MSALIIANWKMNFLLPQAIAFCKALVPAADKGHLIIAAPAPYLGYLALGFKKLKFASQDVSNITEMGAYTGEYSSHLLKSCDINYSLVGHSERRILFGETSNIVKQKAENCLNSGITPIICIGEPLEIRSSNQYRNFILQQLSAGVPVTKKNIIIAYEPIWSIGTGIIPTSEQLEEIFVLINSWMSQSFVAKDYSLVYGGSVNLNNFKTILNICNINGALVGNASLDSNTIIQMLN